MVQINEIAEFIEKGLNSYQDIYNFSLIPLVGDWKAKQDLRKEQLKELPKPFINGTLLSLPSGIVPIKNLKNFYIICQLEFLVKKNDANEAFGFIQNYIEENAGTSSSFDEYFGTVNYDVPSIGTMQMLSPLGACVPIMTTVYWQFIAGGVLSDECKLTIDGNTVDAKTFNFGRSRIADTTNVLSSGEMQSAIGQQGLTLELILPYTKKDKLAVMLMRDCLQGSIGKSYAITYSDNVVNPKQPPLLWQMVAESLAPSFEVQKIPIISAKFVIARSDIYGGQDGK